MNLTTHLNWQTCRNPLRHGLTLALLAATPLLAGAAETINWSAFNDATPSSATHPNATTYGLTRSGPLKDIATGTVLPVGAVVTSVDVATAGTMNAPATGTPADTNFTGICTWTGATDGQNAAAYLDSDVDRYSITFTNLDVNSRYRFTGTSVRGNSAYTTRWTIVTLLDAVSATHRHSSGVAISNVFEVAYNSGDNTAGDIVVWDGIDPGSDGSFTIQCRRQPGANAYGIDPWRLDEILFVVTPVEIVRQPVGTNVVRFRPFSLSVGATGTAPRYQWYKEGVGALAGATASAFSVASAELTDSGNYYVVVQNSLNTVTSSVVQVTVNADTVPPEVASIVPSGAFNQITIQFSERVDEGDAGDQFNYEIIGQIGAGPAVVTNIGSGPFGTAVLLTTPVLLADTAYELRVTNIRDLAGNVVDGIRRYPFRTWALGPANGVLFEAYRPVGGANTINSLTNLASSPNYPDNPFTNALIGVMDSRAVFPDDSQENYGSQMRGLFIPPVTANWRFYIRSDDPGQVYLNPAGPSADGKILIVNETGCCGNWNKYQSEAIPLIAGRGYYIEALQKEGTGGDYLKVAARLDGTGTPQPNDTANLSLDPAALAGDAIGYPAAPAGIGGELTITQQPANITTDENQPVRFTVGLANPNNLAVYYQWYRDGAAIPGENRSSLTLAPTLADSGARFSVLAAIVGSSVQSAEALLTVVTDVNVPRVTQVICNDNRDGITIVYSERVEPLSATSAFNYNFGGEAMQFDGTLLPDGVSVIFSTPFRYNEDTDYVIAINDVEDLAGNRLSTNLTFHSCKKLGGFATFQAYSGLSTTDNSIGQLTGDPDYPNNPDLKAFISAMSSRQVYPDDAKEGYGARMRTFFVPPSSGNWIFYILSDDSSQLWLNSAGDDYSAMALIAEETACCGPIGKAGTVSPPIALTAGEYYAMMMIYKEGTGGDYGFVYAKLESDPAPPASLVPISGSMLAMMDIPVAGATVAITTQPSDQVATIVPVTVGGDDFNTGSGGFSVQNVGGTPVGPWTYDVTNGQWVAQGAVAECGTPWATLLNSPTYTVLANGSLTLTLNHRYAFEGDLYDGGQIRVSLNGGPFTAVTSFSQNGYTVGALVGNHILSGQEGFNGTSSGYQTGTLLASVAQIGPFDAGDQIVIQCVAALDECTTGIRPNWVIDSLQIVPSVQIGSAITPVTFTVEALATVPGQANPSVSYQWERNDGAGFVAIQGAINSSYTLFPTIADNGARFRCVVSVAGAGSVVSDAALLTVGSGGSALTIQRSGGNVTIDYSGTLESAPTVNGPWTEVTGATSPYTTPANEAAKFYRSRQ